MLKEDNDPFFSLKNAVESIFHVAPPRTFPECQRLQEAIQNYQAESPLSFSTMVHALGATLPYFKKWRINFDPIKESIDKLAKQHHMPAVNWDNYLTQPRNSSRFQFNSLQPSNIEFLPWLNSLSKKSVAQKNIISLLITHYDHLGFSQKLNTYLEKRPDFLMALIMESKENFITIAQTRLILFLTDEQIAMAIIKYLPEFQEPQGSITSGKIIVEKLNEILSKGRSISTLMRNSQAKEILEESQYFQFHQQETEISGNEPEEDLEDEYMKPKI